MNALHEGKNVLIDRTNIDYRQRAEWLELANEFRAAHPDGPRLVTCLVLVDTPIDVCKARLAARSDHPTIKDAQSAMRCVASLTQHPRHVPADVCAPCAGKARGIRRDDYNTRRADARQRRGAARLWPKSAPAGRRGQAAEARGRRRLRQGAVYHAAQRAAGAPSPTAHRAAGAPGPTAHRAAGPLGAPRRGPAALGAVQRVAVAACDADARTCCISVHSASPRGVTTDSGSS